jgi:hypothetical protein
VVVVVLEAAVDCDIVGLPPVYKSKLTLILLAPSVNPENVIPEILDDGNVRFPFELNTNVPVLFVGVPVASPDGRAIE